MLYLPEQERNRRKTLQVALPEWKVTKEPWVSSEKKDDRLNKIYQRKVSAGIRVLIRDRGVFDKFKAMIRDIDDAVLESAGTMFQPNGARLTVNDIHDLMGPSRAEGWDYAMLIFVTARFPAEKPSKIFSQEECVAALGGTETIADVLGKALEAGVARGVERQAREERAHLANRILDVYVDVVSERALTAVDYKARLDQLTADYIVALESEARKYLRELGEDAGVRFDEGMKVDPCSIVAAKRVLLERLALQDPPHARRLFPGDRSQFIKPDHEALS